MIKVIPSTKTEWATILIDEKFISYYLVLKKMNQISCLYPGVCIMTEYIYLNHIESNSK